MTNGLVVLCLGWLIGIRAPHVKPLPHFRIRIPLRSIDDRLDLNGFIITQYHGASSDFLSLLIDLLIVNATGLIFRLPSSDSSIFIILLLVNAQNVGDRLINALGGRSRFLEFFRIPIYASG